MDLELSHDQRDLRTLAADLLQARGDFGPARTFYDGAGDAGALFAEIDGLGWYDVGLGHADEFGLAGLCLLASELGAHAAPNLLVDAAVARRLGHEEGVATLAVAEPGGGWTPAGGRACVRSGHLYGTKIQVRHAHQATTVVAVALMDGVPCAVAVDSSDVQITPTDGVDAAGATAEVVFEASPCRMLTADAGQLRRAMAVGAVGTAAESVGAASRALDLAVAYALERRQFGRPIGANQALAHLMAEAHMHRESAWSTVLYAAGSLHEELPDAIRTASIAKAHCARQARATVEAALQVFGGIGFTWEHDAHLLHRRVLDCEQRFGDAIAHEHLLTTELRTATSATSRQIREGIT